MSTLAAEAPTGLDGDRLTGEARLKAQLEQEEVPSPYQHTFLTPWVLSNLITRNWGMAFDSVLKYRTAQRTRTFLGITALEADIRLALCSQVKHRLEPYARFQTIFDDIFAGVLGEWLALLGLAGPIIGLLLEWGRFGSRAGIPFLLLILLGFATMIAAYAVDLAIFWILSKVEASNAWFIFGIGSALILDVVSLVELAPSLKMFRAGPYFTSAGLVGILIMLVLLSAYAIMYVIVELRVQRLNPDSDLLNHLIDVLALVDKQPAANSDMSGWQQIVDHIERIAIILEQSIPRRVRIGDMTTRTWFRKIARHRACAIRQLTQEVLVPGPGSKSTILDCLQKLLMATVSGDWKLAPTVPDSELTERPPKGSRLIAHVTRVLWGAAPVGLFAAWQASPEALTGAYASTGWGITVLWGLVSLAALDPAFDQKIKSFGKLGRN